MAKDPVCNMMVDEKKAKFKSEYNGKTFYFCAAACKTAFDKNPAKYAGTTLENQTVAVADTANR
jgi:YHS domain-containing protein